MWETTGKGNTYKHVNNVFWECDKKLDRVHKVKKEISEAVCTWMILFGANIYKRKLG